MNEYEKIGRALVEILESGRHVEVTLRKQIRMEGVAVTEFAVDASNKWGWDVVVETSDPSHEAMVEVIGESIEGLRAGAYGEQRPVAMHRYIFEPIVPTEE